MSNFSAQFSNSTNSLAFWNKSHVNFFSLSAEAQILEYLATVPYAGRHPNTIAEILASQEKFPNFSPYSIYDYYDNRSFPVELVRQNTNTEIYQRLLKKTKAEQLLVLDLESEDYFRILIYTAASGLELFEFNLGGAQGENEFLAPLAAELLANKNLQGFIAQNIKLDNNLNTAWVFTGESALALQTGVEQILSAFFLNLGSLPDYNQIFLDKYNLLGYLELLPPSFVQQQFSSIFYSLPLSLINTNIVTGKLKPLLKGGLNFFSAAESSSFSYLLAEGGVKEWLWLWEKLNGRSAGAFRSFIGTKLNWQIDLKTVQLFSGEQFPIHDSTWTVPLTQKLQTQLTPGKKVSWTKHSASIPLRKTQFMEVTKLTKDDLLVVNGQKVNAGEQLTREKNVNLIFEVPKILAPAAGTMNTQYLQAGFLGLTNSIGLSKDLGWLEQLEAKTLRLGSNSEVEFGLQVESMPLFLQLGIGYSGVLVAAATFQEALAYAKEMAGIVLAVDESVKAAEVLKLYQAGVKALLVPSLPDWSRIPAKYWQLFSLGAQTLSAGNFPEIFWQKLLQNQYREVFIDSKRGEVKLALQTGSEAKFTLGRDLLFGMRQRQVVAPLQKDDRVLFIQGEKVFTTAKVLYLEDSGLLLVKAGTETFRADSSQVAKITC